MLLPASTTGAPESPGCEKVRPITLSVGFVAEPPWETVTLGEVNRGEMLGKMSVAAHDLRCWYRSTSSSYSAVNGGWPGFASISTTRSPVSTGAPPAPAG